MKQENEPVQILYNDRIIWLFILPFVAIAIVHIANENSLSWLLQNPTYYFDILFSLTLTYLIAFYVKKTIVYLDKYVPWKRFKKRLLFQSILCLFAPCIFILIIEPLFVYSFENVTRTYKDVLNYEVPIAFIFLLLLQLSYFVIYQQHLTKNVITNKIPLTEKPYETRLPVIKGNKELLIDTFTISYFYTLQKGIFAITTESKAYACNESLDELIQKLEPGLFYRLNRQVIANRNSIVSVERTPTRKLHINLNPPIDPPVFVSKAKATEFLQWWKKALVSI